VIDYESAYELMMASARPLGAERVPLAEALNRVLAENVASDVDCPPFDKAAMDGYACRRQDLGSALSVVEEIPAGYVSRKAIGSGECARIMTGAPVPEGADVVIMVEQVEEAAEGRIRFVGNSTGNNICPRAEDVRAGDVVLREGTLLTPPCLAVLAAAGAVRPLVARRVRVGVVATGNEVVDPSEKPGPAAVRDSNSWQLCAQVRGVGALPCFYGIARDESAALQALVAKAKQENDVVLLSGGVSAGKYDLVPDVLRACGFELRFESVAMQPGKPTVFGIAPDGYCCGLPGNPAATFVVFEILLKPFLYRLMGHDYRPRPIPAVFESEVRRRNTTRQWTFPVAFTATGGVAPTLYHGSAHIAAMCAAEGLLTVPAGVAAIQKGATVYVRPL
jgi:molybdopterin molybdotransferase